MIREIQFFDILKYQIFGNMSLALNANILKGCMKYIRNIQLHQPQF